MKRFKKLASFILAAAMVLTMGLTAFAAPKTDYTITVNNTTEGASYSLYKLASKVYDIDNENDYHWEINDTVISSEVWDALVEMGSVGSETEGRKKADNLIASLESGNAQQIANALANSVRNSSIAADKTTVAGGGYCCI